VEIIHAHSPQAKGRIGRLSETLQGNLVKEMAIRWLNLDKILCNKAVRALENDFTIVHNSKLFQIQTGVRPKAVTVEKRFDGSMFITLNGVRLPFRQKTAEPENHQKSTIRGTIELEISATAGLGQKASGGQHYNRALLLCRKQRYCYFALTVRFLS
jgi:hypothetical protein